jgi:transposase-like protein
MQQQQQPRSAADWAMAQMCVQCPACKKARDEQQGPAYWVVKHVGNVVCPPCRAYEKVYGRKAHEPAVEE